LIHSREMISTYIYIYICERRFALKITILFAFIDIRLHARI